MNKVWKVVRTIVSVLLLTSIGLPTLMYVLLSVDKIQDKIRNSASAELSHLLGAKVDIGNLGVRPFNRFTLTDISIVDSAGTDTLATVRRVSAGIELWRLVRSGDLVVDYALLDGANVRIWKTDSVSPLNIQPVLDHLKSDRPREHETPFELSINTVIIRRGTLTYDILSAPTPLPDRFNPAHIHVSDIALNAYIPRIGSNGYRVDLDHFSASERSGFAISRLSAKASFEQRTLSLSNFEIDFGQSRLTFEPVSLSLGENNLRQSLADHPLELKTKPDCKIYLPDFKAFVPVIGQIPQILDFDLDLSFDNNTLDLRHMALRHTGNNIFGIAVSAKAEGLDSIGSAHFQTRNVTAIFDGREISTLLSNILPQSQLTLLKRLPVTAITMEADGTPAQGTATIRSDGDAGHIVLEGRYNHNRHSTRIAANLVLSEFNTGLIAGQEQLGPVTGTFDGDITIARGITGSAHADLSSVEWNGYTYRNLAARADIPRPKRIEATVALEDPNATALVYTFYDGTSERATLSATASLANINPGALGLPDPKPGYRCGAKLIAELSGNNIDEIAGTVDLTDIRWLDQRNHGFRIPRLSVTADPLAPIPCINVTSDMVNGTVSGQYAFSSIVRQLKNLSASFVPVLFPEDDYVDTDLPVNNFRYDFRIESTEEFSRFFGLPVSIVYPAHISGRVNSTDGIATAEIDAPYVLHSGKIYDHTTIYANMHRPSMESLVYVTTQFPTKKGDMAMSATVKAFDNRIDTHIDWTIERKIPLNGAIDFSTLLTGLPERKNGMLSPVEATVSFNPGTVNFGYDTWNIPSSTIEFGADRIVLDEFALDADTQHIRLDGTVSMNPTDTLTVNLSGIHLLPIFETLEIDKAMLSGNATGTFKASSLLTDNRVMECKHLRVDSIGYNRCVIGDADILARWDKDKRSVFLDADIEGDNGHRSRITGNIFPFDEALDLDFAADSVPVGFLKPFMDAFARDITGRASGHCRLFGTFKEIDLTGDVYADNVSMAVDFTNTVYSTSDSVHMRPGRIIIPSATIYDADGHSARLTGWVNHTYFKEPAFRFDVTDAQNFLSFNGTPLQNPDWYGTIYGNGTASVYGEPGVVNIEADMTTAPRSTFTFVLSDRLDAVDYSFINFRDLTPDSLRVPSESAESVPPIVRQLQNRIDQENTDEPSDYKMKISVDITPDAALTLVMDPATDDEIKATGSGHVTMSYNSTDEDLRIYGAYNVNSGSYHFTLQDIIIKDFTIKEGSSINFDGDPYAVRADLNAYYATNANLSDLDESFLQDREVARTKVPVHALMNIRGDIRQPDINFDLEFPTLTSDTYRKVRSIVSTSDMMNRQIIYLLALNRFYTPDYMNSTTKGSELFSVASSTISSQLGSLLGKISDNWSIAPNLRSDRGDFSDLEVDVALSSRLLNNRLLFNGNFGYRDKSLNSNQFVGDFDIEYLLNKRGTWRLKAYNRYNDANYYLRQAATTQGVGIMYRRDFDNIFSFLRPKKKKKQE